MLEISKLRQRSNAFVKQLNVIISQVIEDNDEKLIELNQKQLRDSKKADGQPITPKYSPAYARFKGYSNPDGYLTGEMYKSMFAVVDETKNQYNLSSYAEHTKYFAGRYGNVFGIAPKNQPLAQKYYTRLLAEQYRKLVLT